MKKSEGSSFAVMLFQAYLLIGICLKNVCEIIVFRMREALSIMSAQWVEGNSDAQKYMILFSYTIPAETRTSTSERKMSLNN